MDFRRSSQRRRRVALDQQQVPSDAVESAEEFDGQPSLVGAARPYATGARRSSQPKTTDLIPKRSWSLAIVLLALAAAVGGLNALDHYCSNWTRAIGEQGIELLSLQSHTGLTAWYTNLLLLATCCASLQVYLLRQHRRDDYRGTYRIWLWLAVILVLASAACVTGIQSTTSHLISWLTNSEGSPRALGWLLAAKLVCLSLLVGRGLFEVRVSPAASIGLVVVGLAYGTAALLQVPQTHAYLPLPIETTYGNAILIGTTSLFFSTLLYARHVYLVANGLIKQASLEDIESHRLAKQQKKDQRETLREEKREAKQRTLDEKKLAIEVRKEERAAKAAQSKSARELTQNANSAAQKSDKKRNAEHPTASRPSLNKKKVAASAGASKSDEKQPRKSRAGSHAPTPTDADMGDASDSLPQGSPLSKNARRKQRKQKRRAA